MTEDCTNVCLATNFKTLTKSISSAQSSIFRCKSTLKCIEEELIYLNLSCNTNTNNRDSKRVQQVVNSPNPEVIPYNVVDIDANQTKILDSCAHNNQGENGIKPSKSRRSLTNVESSDGINNYVFSQDTNVCNISGELTNLLRAQQKLLCQIEKLKSDIGDKSSSIDSCIKENKFFHCKFKEVENQIEQIKKDIEKIKKDLAMTVSKDRGFSPYSYDSRDCGVLVAPLPASRHVGYRGTPQEHHYGYQDVCTPDHSAGIPYTPRQSVSSLRMNLRDGNCQAKTFEDLIRKSKMEIDCNINNCRNNQNMSSLNVQSNNNVLMDFVSLNNQIKSLRRMAETIFRNNCRSTVPVVDEQVTSMSRVNETTLEDLSKSSINKSLLQTTLSLINQPRSTEQKRENKEDSSSPRSSVSDSDTSCCFCTEDQFPANSPEARHNTTSCKPPKTQPSTYGGQGKRFLSGVKQQTGRDSHRNKEANGCRHECTVNNNCGTYKSATNDHSHTRPLKQVCPECKNIIGMSRRHPNH